MTNLPTDFESAFYTADGRQGYQSPEARLRYWFLKVVGIGPLNASLTMYHAVRRFSAGAMLAASLPFLQLVTYRIGRGNWGEALKLWLIQMASFNLLFLPFAIGVHHNAADPEGEGKQLLNDPKTQRGTLSWHEGEVGASDDWGIHQVNATEDHTLFGQGPFPEILSNWLSLTCFGYLNDHKLHHLFPAVDHSKHQVLREVFEQTCKDFNVPLKVRGTAELAASFHRYAQKKEVMPIPSKL